MFFAENLFGFSDAVWLAIVGTLAMVVKELLDQWKARRVAEKVAAVAEKAEVAVGHAADNAAAVKDVAAKVEEVHRATNSLTDRLVAKTESEALARGGVEERAKEGTDGKRISEAAERAYTHGKEMGAMEERERERIKREAPPPPGIP